MRGPYLGRAGGPKRSPSEDKNTPHGVFSIFGQTDGREKNSLPTFFLLPMQSMNRSAISGQRRKNVVAIHVHHRAFVHKADRCSSRRQRRSRHPQEVDIRDDRHLAAVGAHDGMNVSDVHCATFTLRDFVQRRSNLKCNVRRSSTSCGGRSSPCFVGDLGCGWPRTASCQTAALPGISIGFTSATAHHIEPSYETISPVRHPIAR